jgi:hypothetical protein
MPQRKLFYNADNPRLRLRTDQRDRMQALFGEKLIKAGTTQIYWTELAREIIDIGIESYEQAQEGKK